MDISKKIDLIKEFLINKNISFDMDYYLSSGVIDITCRNFDDYCFNGQFKQGYNRYDGEHKCIDIHDHGILLDSVCWVHEIVHFLNQTDFDRSEEGKIFTEAISFFYELIYMDYLVHNGYPIEEYYLDNLDGEAGMLKYTSPFLSLFRVYSKTGDVSLDTFSIIYSKKSEDINEYSMYYEPQDFYSLVQEVFDSYDSFVHKEDFYSSYLVGFMYSFALPLQIYSYQRYLEDSSFYDRVEKLNSSVNHSSFLECMDLLLIPYPMTDSFLEQLGEDTTHYMEQIGEYVKKKYL
ncbi:MAG: hypothetical protein IKE70_00200 [Bacilli bacterium]|nr:hypothetical protein [Bacilli bacterium]